MKILIVEDEMLAVEKLQHTLSVIEKDAVVVGTTGSIKSTIQWLHTNPPPDIILMDIELSDGQSFEIFNHVDIESTVIFTTSYDEYAIKAFKVNSIDYLLKPVQKDDLKSAFEKYRKVAKIYQGNQGTSLNIQSLLTELQGRFQPKEFRKRFLVKVGQKHFSVEVEEIAYFYIEDRATCFKMKDNRRFILDYNIDELEEMLDHSRFFRINRSFIISVESVLQIHDYFNSRLMLKLTPDIDKEVIVSREKVNDFKNWMGR